MSGAGPAPSRAWSTLSLYESPELVRRLCKLRTDYEPNAVKALEISAHFSQGREYFRGAAGASELVRPLILYYGATALAWGTVLFLEPWGEGVDGGHGLSAAGWRDLAARPERVPTLLVRVAGPGSFPNLARVTGNLERSWARNEGEPGAVVLASPGAEIPEDTALTVREILGQLPDVAGLYERTFAGRPQRLRCEVSLTGGLEPGVRGVGEEVPDDLEVRRHAWLALFPTALGLPDAPWVVEAAGEGRLKHRAAGLPPHFVSDPKDRAAETHLFDLFYDAGSREDPRLEAPIAALPSGEQYLKLPTADGVVLSSLLALHLAGYATGMLVRYHPGYWAALTGKRKGDAIGPVLSAAASALEERYPGLILEALEG